VGVTRIKEFNNALLGRWCWRMVTNRDGLWFKVLSVRYWVEGGRLREGGSTGSVWWQ